MGKCKRWWLSWWQPTEDFRPLTFPPNEHVLGWWRTGSRFSNGDVSICALVLAETHTQALEAIKQDWPEAKEWRFCEEKADNYVPSDRFPLSDWMIRRVGGE